MTPASYDKDRIEMLESQLTAMTQRSEAAESANAALRDERHTWMAHAERLRDASRNVCNSALGSMQHDEFVAALYHVMSETPPISLAKHDARVMREAAAICAAEVARFDQAHYEDGGPGAIDMGYGALSCQELIEARAAEMEGGGE